MSFSVLAGQVFTVAKVMSHEIYNGQYLAVHGVLNLSISALGREYTLLPTNGRFDGTNPRVRETYNQNQVILILDPSLDDKFYPFSAQQKHDLVVIGQIRWRKDVKYGVTIQNLWIIIMQNSMPMTKGMEHRTLQILNFSHNRMPNFPWEGMRDRANVALLEASGD